MAPEPRLKPDYSYQQSTPNVGTRHELVDGELVVSRAPGRIHQRISRRLQRQLEDYFHARELGEVLDAPLDVILTRHDVFEPDLVVADPSDESERGIEKPPLLIVEILSPSTRNVDRGVKFRRYAELAVPHCWIVDPEAQRVGCFRADAGEYRLVVAAEGDTKLDHPDWDGLVIDLAKLWLQAPFS